MGTGQRNRKRGGSVIPGLGVVAAIRAYLGDQPPGEKSAIAVLSEKSGYAVTLIRKVLHRSPVRYASLADICRTIDFSLTARDFEWVTANAPPAKETCPTEPTPDPPGYIWPFFGREREMETLTAALRPVARSRGEKRPAPQPFLTLTGLGGAGKTRLAVEVFHRVRDAYDGAAFVELAALNEGDSIPDAIRRALGLPRAVDFEPLPQVAAFLNRHAAYLLVLDNFEHLREQAGIVRTLLLRAPCLRILVTSRVPLGIEGERLFPVPLLPIPATGDTPDRLLEIASIQVFLSRARLIQPDFPFGPENAPDIVRLCQHLEGIPLALELTAGWVGTCSPAEILAQWEQGSHFLTNQRRDVPDRHHTLSAALEGSYRLLRPEAQQLFLRLFVFRGGCHVTAVSRLHAWISGNAGAVALQTLPLLRELRQFSLIQASEHDGEVRFTLLETLREFGAEKLLPEERDAVRRWHAEHFCRFAEEAQPRLTQAGQQNALRALHCEHDNLRAALSYSVSTPTMAEIGLRLTAALWRFWYLTGYAAEGAGWIQRALETSSEMEGEVRARALEGMSRLLCDLRRHDESVRYARASLELAEQLQIPERIAAAHYAMGICVAVTDDGKTDYPLSASHFRKSLEGFTGIGDGFGCSKAMHCLGMMALYQEDYATARNWLEQSLRSDRERKYTEGVADNLVFLGITLRKQGNYSEAEQALRQSLDHLESLGLPRHRAEALEELGYLAIVTHRPVEGAKLLGAAMRVRDSAGVTLSLPQRQEFERGRSDACDQIGTAAFEKAFRLGYAMDDAALKALLARST